MELRVAKIKQGKYIIQCKKGKKWMNLEPPAAWYTSRLSAKLKMQHIIRSRQRAKNELASVLKLYGGMTLAAIVLIWLLFRFMPA